MQRSPARVPYDNRLIVVPLLRLPHLDALLGHADGAAQARRWRQQQPGFDGIAPPATGDRNRGSAVLSWLSDLERNVVWGDVVRRCPRHCHLARFDSRASAAKKLHVASDDLVDPTLPALLVLEGAVLHATLDVERVALVNVATGRLGQSVPADDGVILGALLPCDLAVGG